MTPEMIALAKSNAAKRNITNVEFLQGKKVKIKKQKGRRRREKQR